MLGTPAHLVAVPSLNGPLAGPTFFVAVVAIGIVATVAYAAPATEGPPPNQLQRTLAAEFAFGLWSGLGCLAVLAATRAAGSDAYSIGIDGQFTGPTGVPEPGGAFFALTCLAWTAPFAVIAWRRRRAWIVVAALALAIAAAGTANLFAHPPDNFYTPKPPAALLLAIVALGVVAAILYGDAPPTSSYLEPRTRAVLVQVFFGAWVLLGLVGMTVGLAVSKDNPEAPGGTIFAAACLVWTLPYTVAASRRRTMLWIILAAISIAIALFGIVYRLINPASCGCD